MSAGIETALKRFGEVLSTAGRQHAAALLVLAAVVAAAYSNSVLADLRSDEEALIAASIEGIPGTDLQGLGALIVGIESRLFGFASAPYRVLSMAWHLAAAFGVYLVARRLARDGAYGWFAATLAAAAFAAHPASTHAVNALTDRGVLVGSALALLGAQTMLAAASVPVGNPRRWGYAAISWAQLAAAWSANPATVLAAPLLPALDYAAHHRIAWRLHAPAIGLLIVLTLLRGVAQALAGMGPAAAEPTHVLDSLRMAFAPLTLLVYHAPSDPSDNLLWLGLLAVGLAAFAVRPALGVGVLWFALAVRFAPGTDGAFRESALHLPIVGLALVSAFVLVAPRAPTVRAVVALPMLLLVVAGIALTSTRNNVWRSEAALWLEASEACPACVEPLDRLGRLHFDQAARALNTPGSDANETRIHLESAAKLLGEAAAQGDPSAERAAIRASALRLLGQAEEADAVLSDALTAYPTNPDLALALSESFLRATTFDQQSALRALRLLRLAQESEALPDSSRVRYAQVLAALGDWGEAAATLQRVAQQDATATGLRSEVNARLRAAQTTLAAYYQTAGSVSEADHAAIKSAALDAEGHYQLASLVAWNAHAQHPEVPGPWRAAGIAAQHMGTLAQFIAAGVPASLGADAESAWTELATYLAQLSEWGGTEQVFIEALGLSEYDAAMRTAALAREMNRVTLASSYLQRAAGLDEGNPAPWLELADLAIEAQQQDAARQAIANAEQRGADADQLNALRTLAGMGATDVEGLRRTTIR